MSNAPDPTPDPWHYGVHTRAGGLRVRSLERVELPLGEAIRLEMVLDPAGPDDVVVLQYVVATPAGLWALWTSGARADLAAAEAALADIVAPFNSDPQDRPPGPHPPGAPFAGCEET